MLINRTPILLGLLFVATAVFFIRAHRRYGSRKSVLLFQVVMSFYFTVLCGHLLFTFYTNSPSFLFMQERIFGLSFVLEPIGIIFLNMVSFLWFLTSLYSLGYVSLNPKINANKLSFFMIGAISSTFMLAIAGDLITTFLFYELLTLLTFPLIIGTGAPKETGVARKYICTLMALSLILFLPAIVIVYYFSGGAEFIPGGILKGSSIPAVVAIPVFLMFIYGIAKTAIMPVHFWLPSAMVAPIPVSALLHAVAVVKSGLFILLKICVYIYGVDYLAEIFKPIWNTNLVVILCGISVTLSVFIALYQDGIKKLLAYSTINHMSICLLSAVMFSVAGIKAAIIHMIGHAVTKISLFFTAGILDSKFGITTVNDLKGLSKRSKGLAFIFTLAAISMIGIPPLAGFMGKAYVFYAATMNKTDYFVIIVLSISILVSASYFVRLIYNMYFAANENHHTSMSQKQGYSGIAMRIATILGCLCILLYAASFPFLMKFLNKIQFNGLIDTFNTGGQ